MKLDRETALIEAILFLEGDPINTKQLVKFSNLSLEVVEHALTQLHERYASEDSGIELVEVGGGWQLVPKAELWDYLKDRYGKHNDNKLSRAALETLSIIAYSQPITRGEIENIRGVSADSMIKLLQNRGLVKGIGKKDVPGKPTQYGTTKEFLKLFRLKSISDLPKLDDINRDRFELNG
ncbi:SMC-Scp complex subunit ScpB [Sediminispirochaeta smaragdinae]|jgi:segregation and condensation protein B|uniref:Chromosome segregation and condensation protein, ScpB n=1 Tax=Sediminispirochaeta smaragdinae (strain DSM 11293 / JCM 15392 / SEBR 4228) TaxID=573413 RepID=E1R2Y9_SEDSS|nr:SMC-Scp complex subunit ScpB [Sediminispirochaeta smaragdinae]ADK81175.1 chromosome segregation and condensation protein, ScpB [Sediminispirochaeta smaragdinae DSM 11293]